MQNMVPTLEQQPGICWIRTLVRIHPVGYAVKKNEQPPDKANFLNNQSIQEKDEKRLLASWLTWIFEIKGINNVKHRSDDDNVRTYV